MKVAGDVEWKEGRGGEGGGGEGCGRRWREEVRGRDIRSVPDG